MSYIDDLEDDTDELIANSEIMRSIMQDCADADAEEEEMLAELAKASQIYTTVQQTSHGPVNNSIVHQPVSNVAPAQPPPSVTVNTMVAAPTVSGFTNDNSTMRPTPAIIQNPQTKSWSSQPSFPNNRTLPTTPTQPVQSSSTQSKVGATTATTITTSNTNTNTSNNFVFTFQRDNEESSPPPAKRAKLDQELQFLDDDDDPFAIAFIEEIERQAAQAFYNSGSQKMATDSDSPSNPPNQPASQRPVASSQNSTPSSQIYTPSSQYSTPPSQQYFPPSQQYVPSSQPSTRQTQCVSPPQDMPSQSKSILSATSRGSESQSLSDSQTANMKFQLSPRVDNTPKIISADLETEFRHSSAWAEMLKSRGLPPFGNAEKLDYNIKWIHEYVRQPSSSKSSRIVPYLAVLIKSINIEGTGGAAVQLRDPTGDVSASFNQSVFKKYPHLQKGSVLWLQRSGIFMDNCEPLLVAVADNIVQVWQPSENSQAYPAIPYGTNLCEIYSQKTEAYSQGAGSQSSFSDLRPSTAPPARPPVSPFKLLLESPPTAPPTAPTTPTRPATASQASPATPNARHNAKQSASQPRQAMNNMQRGEQYPPPMRAEVARLEGASSSSFRAAMYRP